MQNEKQKLRREVLQKRTTLGNNYVKDANQKIINQLLSLMQYQESQTIFTFIGKQGEIDTKPLIEDAIKCGKLIGIPRVYPYQQMKVHQFTDWSKLELSSIDILEPSLNAKVINAEQIDLIVLPCVTCNNIGERLGYGGGFYDRFLSNPDVTATTVLPCFSKLQTEHIPTELSDVKADIVINENEIYFNE